MRSRWRVPRTDRDRRRTRGAPADGAWFSKLVDVTTGDPSAPKPTVARTASRAVPKKATAKTAAATAGSPGTREPKVSVSKAGSAGPSTKRGAAATTGTDDILDRLAKLSEAPAVVDDPSDAMPLPTIVEADPTYPPLAVPAAARQGADVIDRDTDASGGPSTDGIPRPASTEGADGTNGSNGVDGTGRAAAAVVELAPTTDAATAVAAVSAVSADLPTALVATPEVEALAPAPDRTEIVPVTPPVVPVSPVPEAIPTIGNETADETSGVVLPKRPLRAPMVFRRAKPRVRRVTRVVRHVDTWSVFKVALVFDVMLYLVCLTSGVLLWNVAHATGTVDNVEKFFEQFGWESFEFKGGEIYHNAWIGGLFVAIGLTGFAVLMATLFNLITDLVGGIRVSVLEEEVVVKQRGAPAAPPAPSMAPVIVDGTDGLPRA